MKPSKLYEALHALIGERVPLHIWGACGVGKSQIVHQVADDLNYDFLDVRAVQLDPVDLCGLPRVAAGAKSKTRANKAPETGPVAAIAQPTDPVRPTPAKPASLFDVAPRVAPDTALRLQGTNSESLSSLAI
jgi:MoxR-like ATPase